MPSLMEHSKMKRASVLLSLHRTLQSRITFLLRDAMLALRNRKMMVSRLKRKWDV